MRSCARTGGWSCASGTSTCTRTPSASSSGSSSRSTPVRDQPSCFRRSGCYRGWAAFGSLEVAARSTHIGLRVLGARRGKTMASAKTKSAPARAARKAVHPEQFSFEVPNEPNADILLESLRSSGYHLESVVGDLIDNPIDADASLIVVNM